VSSTVHFESSSELARIQNTFSVDSVATDPTTVSLVITDPTQASTTYTYAASTITKVSTGVYRKDVPCSIDGTWTYEWTGTGAASDDVAGTWEVFPTDLGKLYATVESLKAHLGITDTVNDFELHQACMAASRSLEQYCQRVFYRSGSVARKFIASDSYCLKFSDTDTFIGDLVSLSALKTDDGGDGTFETTWTSTDYELGPVNAAAGPEARPYTTLEAIGSYTFPIPYGRGASRYRVEVTGVWGWPSVPFGIKQAALLLAKETFKSKDTVGGVAGFGEFGAVRLRQDPLLHSYANPYRRYAAMVA
jgi:hypothetical protein